MVVLKTISDFWNPTVLEFYKFPKNQALLTAENNSATPPSAQYIPHTDTKPA